MSWSCFSTTVACLVFSHWCRGLDERRHTEPVRSWGQTVHCIAWSFMFTALNLAMVGNRTCHSLEGNPCLFAAQSWWAWHRRNSLLSTVVGAQQRTCRAWTQDHKQICTRSAFRALCGWCSYRSSNGDHDLVSRSSSSACSYESPIDEQLPLDLSV